MFSELLIVLVCYYKSQYTAEKHRELTSKEI